MSNCPSPATPSSLEDDLTPAEALDMACEPLGPRKAPPERGIKLPKQKRCKSVAKPPLLVLPEKQTEVIAEPPFVKKQKALVTNANEYKEAVSAWNKANLRIQSAGTDSEASLAKSECAAVLQQIRFIESVVASRQFTRFGPVKSESASAKSLANRNAGSK